MGSPRKRLHQVSVSFQLCSMGRTILHDVNNANSSDAPAEFYSVEQVMLGRSIVQNPFHHPVELGGAFKNHEFISSAILDARSATA